MAIFAAMKKSCVIFWAMTMGAASALAQGQEQDAEQLKRQLTVVDVETLVPPLLFSVVEQRLKLHFMR